MQIIVSPGTKPATQALKGPVPRGAPLPCALHLGGSAALVRLVERVGAAMCPPQVGRNISCHDLTSPILTPASSILTPLASILTPTLSICPPNVLHPHRVSPMAPGFSGVHCEIDIDECNPDPCHYGTCKDSIAAFTCLCQPGYTGHRCDININECQSQPCRNGGTCQDRDNAYNCLCLKGTTGKQWEHLGRRCQRSTQPILGWVHCDALL